MPPIAQVLAGGYPQLGGGHEIVSAILAALTDIGASPTDPAGLTAWIQSNYAPGMSWAALKQPTTGIELDLQGNGACAAWWGDGSTDSYALNTSSDATVAHTYASAATRPVVVLGDITRWSGTNSTLTSYGTKVQYLPASLTYLVVWGSNTLSGDIGTLPASLTYLSVGGSNTLSGDISTAPASLTYLSVGGSNTLSASLGTSAGIPTPVSYVNISNMLTASVDNVLEAMAANVLASKPRGDRVITLNGGTAQPRSTASDAAVTTLTSATPPYTVTTA